MAFVTSAIREAPNGEEVLARVRAETGVALQVLHGEDEARLTFLAARRWFGWSSGTLLVVDIGGGSLELAAGMDEEPDAAVSPAAGRRPAHPRPAAGRPARAEVVRARRAAPSGAAIAARVRPLAKAGPPDRAVGTSKTMRSLARITGAAPSSEGPYAARALERVRSPRRRRPSSSRMTAAERVALPGGLGVPRRASCSPARSWPRRRWTCSASTASRSARGRCARGSSSSRLDSMG